MRLFGHYTIRNEKTNRKHSVNILQLMTGTLLWNWEGELKQILANLSQRRKMITWIVNFIIEDHIDGSLNKRQRENVRRRKTTEIKQEKPKRTWKQPVPIILVMGERLKNWWIERISVKIEHYFTRRKCFDLYLVRWLLQRNVTHRLRFRRGPSLATKSALTVGHPTKRNTNAQWFIKWP